MYWNQSLPQAMDVIGGEPPCLVDQMVYQSVSKQPSDSMELARCAELIDDDMENQRRMSRKDKKLSGLRHR